MHFLSMINYHITLFQTSENIIQTLGNKRRHERISLAFSVIRNFDENYGMADNGETCTISPDQAATGWFEIQILQW